jgi:hypothetical protein
MDKNELEKLENIKAFSETDGGIYVRDTAKEVVLNTIQMLSNTYQEKTHTELIALCAKMSANLSLFQLLTGIEDQIEAIKELYEQK